MKKGRQRRPKLQVKYVLFAPTATATTTATAKNYQPRPEAVRSATASATVVASATASATATKQDKYPQHAVATRVPAEKVSVHSTTSLLYSITVKITYTSQYANGIFFVT